MRHLDTNSNVPYGQRLNMVKVHAFTWAIILESMVLEQKKVCLVFYVLKNYEKIDAASFQSLTPISHSPILHFHQQTNFDPYST